MYKTIQMNTKAFTKASPIHLKTRYILHVGKIHYGPTSCQNISVTRNRTKSLTPNNSLRSISQNTKWNVSRPPSFLLSKSVSLNAINSKRGLTDQARETQTRLPSISISKSITCRKVQQQTLEALKRISKKTLATTKKDLGTILKRSSPILEKDFIISSNVNIGENNDQYSSRKVILSSSKSLENHVTLPHVMLPHMSPKKLSSNQLATSSRKQFSTNSSFTQSKLSVSSARLTSNLSTSQRLEFSSKTFSTSTETSVLPRRATSHSSLISAKRKFTSITPSAYLDTTKALPACQTSTFPASPTRPFSSGITSIGLHPWNMSKAKTSRSLNASSTLLACGSSCASSRRLFSSASLKLISTEEAVAHIQPNSVVFVEGVVGTPKVLMNAMYDHVKRNHIQGVTLLDVFSLYPYDSMTLEDKCVRRLSFFVSPYTRKFVNKGSAEYIPLMLNDLPMVFDRGYFTPDVALISVSPPDDRGFVSLGTNVTELLSVIRASKLVIAQVNDQMPRSLGDALIHVDQIDYGVEVSYDLFTPASEPVTEVDSTIANLICDELIEDEATLQIGLGKIPEAILNNIKHHKNLGVHTELLTSGVMGLIQRGVINNSKKTIDKNIITATLLLGDKTLYDFVHNNEAVQMKPCSYSNNPAIIRQNHRMTAINTCLEIDITGQVVSDSLGTTIYSGFGGQVDFMRGAMTGEDGRGKAILALPSTDEKSGATKIVSTIKPGAGVVCSRAHINYIVTEYGAVDLCAKSTVQRAYHLIRLAHPNHREALERDAFEILGVMPRA